METTERTSISKGWSSSEIIAQLNVRNAKILAFLLVLVLLGYHGVLKLWNGRILSNFEDFYSKFMFVLIYQDQTIVSG